MTVVDLQSGEAAEARRKEATLVGWLAARSRVLLGFSGGVDSAYLACVAHGALGEARLLAVIGRSASYPAEQWEAARAAAAQIGLRVMEIGTGELADPRYAANPADRCYFCKGELWSVLSRVVEEWVAGAGGEPATIIDGTNADDLHDYRPGMAAAREHGVRSPLAEVGMTKAEVRLLARERGLAGWARPSSPCLSSRLPYGTAVTVERLQQVERAEAGLRAAGIAGDLRVRHHGAVARIEIGAGELARALTEPRLAAAMAAVVRAAGFERVVLDLAGYRSGSLNVLAGVGEASEPREVGAA